MFGILIPMMIMMMMGTMITIVIINSNISMFLWLVVGCLLPTCLVNDYRFIDRRVTIFVTVVVALGGIVGQLSQGSGLSGNAVLVTVALFKTLMSESSFFGSVHSHKDRAPLGRDPRDS